MTHKLPLCLAIVIGLLRSASGLYFFMSKGEIKCFKDELIKNSVRITGV